MSDTESLPPSYAEMPEPASPPQVPAPPVPTPPLPNRHWTETVLSVSAIVIAAISLWIAIDTENTNRQLVAEASWPYLQIYNSARPSDGQRVLSLDIANAGIGPAKIESFEVFWKGKSYRTSQELLRACCGHGANQSGGKPGRSNGALHGVGNSETTGIVLRAGDTDEFVRVLPTSDNTAMYNAFDSARDQITYRVCYCSVFNECWLSDGSNLNPPRLKACPQPTIPYTE